MGKINSNLLWLEASLEVHGETSYLDRFQVKCEGNGLPIWQTILLEGSHAQIKRLLQQIQLLEQGNQMDALLCLSPYSATFSDHIAAYANQECLLILFTIIRQLSKEEQRMILLEQNFSNTCFLECLAINQEQGLALQPFFDFIDDMDALDRMTIFQRKLPSGGTFPLLLARNQTSLLNNGFERFVASWLKLKSQIIKDSASITNEQFCIEMFANKKTMKTFYKEVCDNQSSSALFNVFNQNLIPKEHCHYFSKMKGTLWKVILSLPDDIQRVVLFDALNKGSSLGALFFHGKGVWDMFTNKQWLKTVTSQHDKLVEITSTEGEDKNSYQVMREVMAPMARVCVLDGADNDRNIQPSSCPSPSAPAYPEVHMLIDNQESDALAIKAYVP